MREKFAKASTNELIIELQRRINKETAILNQLSLPGSPGQVILDGRKISNPMRDLKLCARTTIIHFLKENSREGISREELENMAKDAARNNVRAKIIRKTNEYKAIGLKIPSVFTIALEKNCIPLDISMYTDKITELVY